jgi:cholesterol transport system auxiliary component
MREMALTTSFKARRAISRNGARRAGMGLLLAALLLSSCGTGPAPDTYDLTALTGEISAPRRNKQVLVTEPTAVKALNSDQIVVRIGGAEIQYLAKAQWADRLPKLVQARLVEALEGTGKLSGVGTPGQGLAIDDQIVSDIRTFEIATNGSSTARVEISVKLLNDRNGTVRAQKTFSAQAPAGSGNPSFIKALDVAFGAVTEEIVAWVLREM